MGGVGQQPGKLGRAGEHRPVARLDVDVIDVPGFGKLRYLPPVDPLPGFRRRELGADQGDRYLKPALVSQMHDPLRHTFWDTDRGVRDAATLLLVKVSRVRSVKRRPPRERHDT